MNLTAAGKFWITYVLALLLCAVAFTAHAAACDIKRDKNGHIYRSASAVVHFKKANPCPANGATKGSCPGYVVDHIVPLCACGADAPSNMQWQDLKTSKVKDKLERQQCGGKGD